MHGLAHAVSHAPIVACTCARLVDVEVLRVVDVLVGARLDGIEHPGLEVEEDCAGNVASIVRLVEEDILAVAAFCRKVLEVAIAIDTVFLTELLPELLPDAVAALASLQCYYFSDMD